MQCKQANTDKVCEELQQTIMDGPAVKFAKNATATELMLAMGFESASQVRFPVLPVTACWHSLNSCALQ